MTARRGDWIQTYSGRRFYPLDPRPEEIAIEDIAHALGLICRFTGHCKAFLSVAEHCCLISDAAPPTVKLLALLHDASEAYTADIARPVKRDVYIGLEQGSVRHFRTYRQYEQDLLDAIMERFEVSHSARDWETVKRLDSRMLATERDQVFVTAPTDWCELPELLPVRLEWWSPSEAENQFMARFNALKGRAQR